MAYNTHFDPLPLGSVRPDGWLLATMKRQSEGLTGLLNSIEPRPGFKVNPVRENSVWRGGKVGRDFLAISSERAPYYVRGLVASAYVLDDNILKEKAEEWLNYWFANQNKNGNLKAAGVSNYEWWPRMLIVDAVRFYYEATKDMRAISFISNFFNFQRKNIEKHPLTKNIRYYPEWRSWASFRGADNMDSVAWLYRLNEDPSLFKLARILNDQTFAWEKYFLEKKKIHTHGVNLAQGLRKPAVHFMFWPDDELSRASKLGLRKTMEQHGHVSGSISGDEQTSGRGPVAGTELCTVVEFMRTLETMLSVFGSPNLGDKLEKLAFNALPATIAPDYKSHQYFSQANQMYCTAGYHGFYANKMDPPPPVGPWYRDSLLFGAPAGYQCCIYNFHMGWPLFIANMWMKYRKDGLAAILYGPCHVRIEINGVKVTINEKTSYPFSEEIIIHFNCDEPVPFALLLRIPEWCREGQAEVNGEIYKGYGGTFLPIRRTWQKKEVLTIVFPMETTINQWQKGVLDVERGPVVFALNPEEQWHSMDNSPDFPTYEVVPAEENPFKNKKGSWEFASDTVWNYGISKDATTKVTAPDIYSPDEDNCGDYKEDGDFPWIPTSTPVKIRLTGFRLPQWKRTTKRLDGGLNAGPLPGGPLKSDGTSSEEITLIPYGAARLRISLFPEVKE